jgi:hypothetical protein
MDPQNDTAAFIRFHLRELVQRFRVCFEVSPALAVLGEELRPIGFTIELAATHDHPRHEPYAGCDECVPVARALNEVLDFIVPRDFRPSYFEVHRSRTSHQFSPERDNRADLTASVEIVHRDGATRPVDDCELRCRDEIVATLKDLGACERVWHERN